MQVSCSDTKEETHRHFKSAIITNLTLKQMGFIPCLLFQAYQLRRLLLNFFSDFHSPFQDNQNWTMTIQSTDRTFKKYFLLGAAPDCMNKE